MPAEAGSPTDKSRPIVKASSSPKAAPGLSGTPENDAQKAEGTAAETGDPLEQSKHFFYGTGGTDLFASPEGANPSSPLAADASIGPLPAPVGGETPCQDHVLGEGSAATPQTKPSLRKGRPKASSTSALAGLSASMGSLQLSKESYLVKLSHHKEAPQISMGGRVTAGSFFRTSSNPGPGTYSNHQNEGDRQSKYSAKPRYSFGGSSRFGLGANPAKERPGPGHYGTPKDPGLEKEPRAGFGGAPRPSIAGRGNAPGPGAYELRTTMGEARMSTVAGRGVHSMVRPGLQPGPGAYDPSDRVGGKFGGASKVGFGTATRADYAAKRELQAPGPGTYDTHKQKETGTGTSKFSMRSRQREHDLESYIQPGPGHYGGHATQFKAREAYDNPAHYM